MLTTNHFCDARTESSALVCAACFSLNTQQTNEENNEENINLDSELNLNSQMKCSYKAKNKIHG